MKNNLNNTERENINRRRTGKLGEDLAEILLMEKGYEILARNFTCPYGELDIIARNGDVIAFVEVKTRLFGSFGRGSESVNGEKRRRIKLCAAYYLNRMRSLSVNVEFQIIEISAEHLEGLIF